MDNMSEKLLREKLKSEWDEHQFKRIQFSDDLKERITSSAHAQPVVPAPGSHRSPRRKRWMYALAASAAAAIIVLIVPPLANNLATVEPSEPPIRILLVTDDPLSATVEDNSILSALAIEQMDVDDALPLLGESVRWPAYTPEPFELTPQAIVSMSEGANGAEASEVELQFVADARAYTIKGSKVAELQMYAGLKEIAVNGYAAYVDDADASIISIYWQYEGIVYTIAGELSLDEAIAIVESALHN